MEADFDWYENRRSRENERERERERESKGIEEKIFEKGVTKADHEATHPRVAKIIHRVKNKLATSSSSGVILSSVGIFFFSFCPRGD